MIIGLIGAAAPACIISSVVTGKATPYLPMRLGLSFIGNVIGNSGFVEVIIVNEFNEYVREAFSAAGDIVIKSMMGGYLVYLNGKLIGDICDNELFLKRTPTSDRLLAASELRYPYEGSKTLMHVFDSFEDTALVLELLDGMYAELPEKKPAKAR